MLLSANLIKERKKGTGYKKPLDVVDICLALVPSIIRDIAFHN